MKIDRMIGILAILLQQEKVTAPMLAEKFEVSRRTILRDIDALCAAGIPLVTTQGTNGGIAIMEGYKIDRTLLTSSEMQAILAGLRSLDSVSGTRRYAQLMEKLSAGSSNLLSGDQHILIDLSAWQEDTLPPKIEAIHSAMDSTRLISFSYHAPHGDSQRTIEPYDLIFQWSSWYVWGWCLTRQAFRLFKLSRMTAITLGGPFEKRPVPLPDLSRDTVFPPTIPVTARIQSVHMWRILEECGPEGFTQQPDGSLLVSYAFTDRDSIIRWIVSFGGGAELLEPRDLRREIVQFAQQICQTHRES